MLAHLAAAAGQWEESKIALEKAKSTYPVMALVQHVMIASVPFLDVDTSEILALQDRAREWNGMVPEPDPASLGWAFGLLELAPFVKQYLLGPLTAHLGDDAAAGRFAEQLKREAGAGSGDSVDFGNHRSVIPAHMRHAEDRARRD